MEEALLTHQPPTHKANPLTMTKPKSSKKKTPPARVIYRDARGRFISKARHIQLKKRAKPSKQKRTKTPASQLKPILTKKKKVSKKPVVKTTRVKKVSKKKRIITPVVKKKPSTVIAKKKPAKKKEPSKKKEQVKKKRKPRPPKPPKGFEMPVRGMPGMYNVEGIRSNSLAQLALLINDQIARGAKRFRFWYSAKRTPAYPTGIASTGIVSWQLVSTKYKGGVEAWLKKLGGKVFHYWLVIP